MPTATPHHPDGSPVCAPGAWHPKPSSTPLEYSRNDDRRAFLSAQKAWWAPKDVDGSKSRPPVGATIKMDGQPFARFDRVPVFDEEGKIVVGVKYEWVDLVAERLRLEHERELALVREQVAGTIMGAAPVAESKVTS
jgi:hypothetical protein